ncbi:hypothetical protein F511_37714 [Dorcoceras hygrometricum]|uniref:Uncharacterized protein n=1 Tax=Dorcoceras hygrometricum TaxID=472368 RepID=A0A2Z7BWH0_9LAMI|nr:hypothetical protein F511_37714 [Dorcoceras hygrometricum]
MVFHDGTASCVYVITRSTRILPGTQDTSPFLSPLTSVYAQESRIDSKDWEFIFLTFGKPKITTIDTSVSLSKQMKKLYRRGTVHPTPPAVSDQVLAFLPADIMTLTTALSLEEREVLAYLISCSSANFSNTHHKKTTPASAGSSKGSAADHPPNFNCYCFRCYMSYWVKWDSSPNRQLIHEIIDAFEDTLLSDRKKEKNKKERRKGKSIKRDVIPELQDTKKSSDPSLSDQDINFPYSNSEAENDTTGSGGGFLEEDKNEEEEVAEKGSVRRFVSFLGDKIWGAWG